MTSSGEAVPGDEAIEALLAIQRLINDLIAQALQASEVVTGGGDLRATPATLSGTSTVIPTGTATGTTTWVGTAVGIAPELTPDKVKALRTKVAALAAAGLFVAEKLDLLEGLISLVERFTE